MGGTNWYSEALLLAKKHPTIVGMRARASWHRKEGENFLNHSCAAMRQHDREADWLIAGAELLEMEMVAKAGVAAGEFTAYAIGFSHAKGRYIEIETAQGWAPDPFWVQRQASDCAERTR